MSRRPTYPVSKSKSSSSLDSSTILGLGVAAAVTIGGIIYYFVRRRAVSPEMAEKQAKVLVGRASELAKDRKASSLRPVMECLERAIGLFPKGKYPAYLDRFRAYYTRILGGDPAVAMKFAQDCYNKGGTTSRDLWELAMCLKEVKQSAEAQRVLEQALVLAQQEKKPEVETAIKKQLEKWGPLGSLNLKSFEGLFPDEPARNASGQFGQQFLAQQQQLRQQQLQQQLHLQNALGLGGGANPGTWRMEGGASATATSTSATATATATSSATATDATPTNSPSNASSLGSPAAVSAPAEESAAPADAAAPSLDESGVLVDRADASTLLSQSNAGLSDSAELVPAPDALSPAESTQPTDSVELASPSEAPAPSLSDSAELVASPVSDEVSSPTEAEAPVAEPAAEPAAAAEAEADEMSLSTQLDVDETGRVALSFKLE